MTSAKPAAAPKRHSNSWTEHSRSSDVDELPGLGVDKHGGIAAAGAQREVVDPEYPRHRRRAQRNPKQGAEGRVPGNGDAQRLKQPRPGPAR